MIEKNIEWYGTLPKNWSTPKMSYVCNTITDYTASGSFASLAENVIYRDTEDYAMLVRTADLSKKRDINPVFIDEKAYNFLNNSNLFGGELIMSNVGSVGDVYLYEPLYQKASLAPNAIMVRANGYEKFLFYLFSTKQAVEGLLSITNTTTQPKFNKTQLRSFRVPFPDQLTMEKIVKHLDKKTKQIEDIKNKISEEIENLENYKKSVITEAVTKGLDKNVEMKDSGIEWIGEIPKHWKVNRLKFLVIDRQAGIWGKEVESEGDDRNIICIRVADFDFPRMTIRKDRGFTVRNYSNIDIIKYYLDKGDILVEKSGGGEKSPVGRTIIWEENFVAVYANFIERIRMDQNKICPMYAQYVFYAFYNMGISNLFFNQTTGIQNLDLSKMIRTLRFPVPSLNDQLNIINYLNKVIKILDETIEAKQKQLEVLEEYMKSLIYEYVTGKKEVNNGEES